MKYTKIKKILKEADHNSAEKPAISQDEAGQTSKRQLNDDQSNKRQRDDNQSTKEEKDGDQSANEEENLDSSHGEHVEVWGSQFDRKTSKMKETEKLPVRKKETNAYLQKLGNKMFQQSRKMTNVKVSKHQFLIP